MLRYYVSELSYAPYGKDLKGEIRLTGYSAEIKADQMLYVEPPPRQRHRATTSQASMGPAGEDDKDLLLDLPKKKDLVYWLEHIQAHIRYANSLPPVNQMSSI